MTEAITRRESMEGYDIIRTTLKDFRRIAIKYERHPLNHFCFCRLTEYIQFMQTDELFAAFFDDVDDVINSELSKAGLDPLEIYAQILEEAYWGDTEDEY